MRLVVFRSETVEGFEGLLRSTELLLSFKVEVPMFSLCPLTAFLTLTLHLLFVDVLAHLTGVFLRRFTLGEECGMLDIKPVPLRFQLVGLLQKVKHCRRFAVNSIFLDMFPYQ